MTYLYDSAARLTGALDSAGVIYAQTVPGNILAGQKGQPGTERFFLYNPCPCRGESDVFYLMYPVTSRNGESTGVKTFSEAATSSGDCELIAG